MALSLLGLWYPRQGAITQSRCLHTAPRVPAPPQKRSAFLPLLVFLQVCFIGEGGGVTYLLPASVGLLPHPAFSQRGAFTRANLTCSPSLYFLLHYTLSLVDLSTSKIVRISICLPNFTRRQGHTISDNSLARAASCTPLTPLTPERLLLQSQ